MEKKKVKLNFDVPQPASSSAQPADPNTFVDHSGEELRQLQMEMLKRRMQEQNDNDLGDGMQINLKPAQPQLPDQTQNDQVDPNKYAQIKKLLGIG